MIGAVVGSYRILSKIGEGGMGAVYLAEHPLLGKKVAVKVLLPEYSRNAEFVQRFFNEARATTMIKHPGLVDIFDFGQMPDGSAFITMEFLDGESLTATIRRERRVRPDLVVEVARQVASALGAAHAKGIVHRDLKPDNVILLATDEPPGIRAKVLDFGIAKLTSDGMTSSVKTRTGMMMGTPVYMSPEQCRGAGELDHRSDVYSLGCLLYEMLAGVPPFPGTGAGEIIAAHIYAPLPPIPAIPSTLGPPLDALVRRMLEKAPAARHQTMGDVVAEIDSFSARAISGVFVARTPTPPPQLSAASALAAQRPTTLGGAAAQAVAHPAPRRGRTGLWISVAGGVLLGGAALGVYFAVVRSDGPATAKELKLDVTKPVAVSAPLPPVAQPVATSRPARVKLHIDSQPAGAEVFRFADGMRVGTTPFDQEVERGEGQLAYVFKRAGYKDERLNIPVDKESSVTATLSRSHGSSGSSGKAKPKNKILNPFDE